MHEKVEYLSYDEAVDHLVLYKDGEKIHSNLDLGLAILSFNKSKEVVGIEFMGAHRNFKIPLDALHNIKDCSVEIRYAPSQKVLFVNVLIRHNQIQSPLVWSHEGVDLGQEPFRESFACSIA